MMFMLMNAWPVNGGALCVPAGTVIDGTNPQWLGCRLPSVMPIDAKALDAAAWSALQSWYGGSEQARWLQPKGF
jgi:hypothetical protein